MRCNILDNYYLLILLIQVAMDNLQKLLEVVETPGQSACLFGIYFTDDIFNIKELLESVVKLLMTISRQHPHSLNQYFKVCVCVS